MPQLTGRPNPKSQETPCCSSPPCPIVGWQQCEDECGAPLPVCLRFSPATPSPTRLQLHEAPGAAAGMRVSPFQGTVPQPCPDSQSFYTISVSREPRAQTQLWARGFLCKHSAFCFICN